MCLAVPLRLISVNGPEGVGERDGIRREVRLDFLADPQVGDYVICHAGFAIEKLGREQAEEDIAAAREVEAELAALYAAAPQKGNAEA